MVVKLRSHLKPTHDEMTTTMMRLRQHLASSYPIYTSAVARIGHRRRLHLPVAPPPDKHHHRPTSTTTKPPILLLLCFFLFFSFSFLIIPTVLFPPARVMSSSSSSSSSAVPFEKPRAVVKKLLAESQPEGQGATVRRSIGRYCTSVRPGSPDFLSPLIIYHAAPDLSCC